MKTPTILQASAYGLSLLVAACLSVQDFDDKPTSDSNASLDAGNIPMEDAPSFPQSPRPAGTWRWEWVNPAPTGRSLFGVGATSDSDIWVAGDGGTIAHFDGTKWDIRHMGPPTMRYFDIGIHGPKDVWVAGLDSGKSGVVHFNGKEWIDSYPFAGSSFRRFSHGSSSRLFAIVDEGVLELSKDGAWAQSDTRENDVFGSPVDIWVSATGEAWLLTTGGLLMKLGVGSTRWRKTQSFGTPASTLGLALSGSGSRGCAFYMGRSPSDGGVGMYSYDGSGWIEGPRSANRGPEDDGLSVGSRSSCFADGSGILLDGDGFQSASTTTEPRYQTPFEFFGDRMFAMLSSTGTTALAVGQFGRVMTRKTAGSDWTEVGPTSRNNIVGIDVGIDGAAMAITSLAHRTGGGGEVRFFQEGTLALREPKGFAAPSLPAAITVIGKDDAWISSDTYLEMTHWTGRWGLTKTLPGIHDHFSQALWAAEKDNVWLASTSKCPDLTPLPNGACSKKQSASLWHYEGTEWTETPVSTTYRSIHGSGPNDVWFAGDGVAHWDGKKLTVIEGLAGRFAGVWSSVPGRVWLWGDRSILYDGNTSIPLREALHTAADWIVSGIAESKTGDVFVLTERAAGSSLLWFDPTRSRLLEQIPSDLKLTAIRGRGDDLWAIGEGGAALRFAKPIVR